MHHCFHEKCKINRKDIFPEKTCYVNLHRVTNVVDRHNFGHPNLHSMRSENPQKSVQNPHEIKSVKNISKIPVSQKFSKNPHKNPHISIFVIKNFVSGSSALLKAAYLEALLYSLRNYINQL